MSFRRGNCRGGGRRRGIGCTAHTAAADESGTFTLLSSMTTDYTMIAHAGGTVIGGASEGTSTTIRSSGGPFVEGGALAHDVRGAWEALGRGHGARGGLHIDDARGRRAVRGLEEKCGRCRRRRRRGRRARAHGWDREPFRGHRIVHLRGRLSGEQPICLCARSAPGSAETLAARRTCHGRGALQPCRPPPSSTRRTTRAPGSASAVSCEGAGDAGAPAPARAGGQCDTRGTSSDRPDHDGGYGTMNQQQLEKIRDRDGFIAALDQSGGSTPEGASPVRHRRGGVFRRRRDVLHHPRDCGPGSSPARASAETAFSARSCSRTPWTARSGACPPRATCGKRRTSCRSLKVDKGLAPEENGAQVMKPMPELDPLLARAKENGVSARRCARSSSSRIRTA